MNGSREEKARQWADRVVAFEHSGLGRRRWCAQQGLSPSSLDYWRHRLRPKLATLAVEASSRTAVGREAVAAVVPIMVASEGTRCSDAVHVVPQIEIEAAGLRVRVREADVAWLAALLKALRC
jgi:hypothetical protein